MGDLISLVPSLVYWDTPFQGNETDFRSKATSTDFFVFLAERPSIPKSAKFCTMPMHTYFPPQINNIKPYSFISSSLDEFYPLATTYWKGIKDQYRNLQKTLQFVGRALPSAAYTFILRNITDRGQTFLLI